MPADGCGVKQNICALQAGNARALRIPLVPAHQHSDPRVTRLEILKPEIARRKVIFFVIERIIGNVHFPVHPDQFTIRVQNRRRVVIQTLRALLKERSHNRDLQFFRNRTESLRRWAWDRLRQVEKLRIFFTAEILASEKLGQANDFRTLRRRFPNALDRSVQIAIRIGRAGHLHQSHHQTAITVCFWLNGNGGHGLTQLLQGEKCGLSPHVTHSGQNVTPHLKRCYSKKIAMLDITKDIQSLTTFRRESSDIMKQLKKTKRPMILTVAKLKPWCRMRKHINVCSI